MYVHQQNKFLGWLSKTEKYSPLPAQSAFLRSLKMLQRTVMGGLDTVKMFQASYVQSTMFYTITKLSCWFFLKSVTGTLKINDKILHHKVLLSKLK